MITKSSSIARNCGLAVVLFLLATNLAIGQTVTGSISGTAVDPSGAVLANARVTVTSETTGVSRAAATNDTGSFVVVGLTPGQYRLTLEIPGFRKYERTGLSLTANERISLGNVEMAVGSASESVTVSAESPKVNAETADTAANLSSAQLSDVMVRGRDLMNILKLLPGTSQSGGSESAGGMWGSTSPNISGTRSRNNNLSLDGQNASDIHLREYFAGAVSADAVGEVKVLSSTYMAEIGPNPGASVNVISKSGTREFHGSGYWFTRHEQFNAVDFFTKRNGLVNPRYRFTNVGVTLGGPVTIPHVLNSNRSKLFFFYSGEGWRSLLPTTRLLYTVPTEAERRGDFSQSTLAPVDPSTGARFPNNVIPQSQINAQGRALVNVLPLPNQLNRAVTGGSYNYEFQNFQDAPKQQHLLKVDWTPTGKDTFTFRPKLWQADTRYWSGLGFGGPPLTYFNYYYTKRDAKFGWTRSVSPSVLNEFNAAFGGSKERGLPKRAGQFDGVQKTTYGINLGQLHPENNPYGFLPSMTFGGVNNPPNTTVDLRWPIDCGDEVLEFSNNLSLVRGRHTAKFGIYAQRTWASEGIRATAFNGTFDFTADTNNPGNAVNPFATAMLGNFRSYTEASARNRGLGTTSLVEWFAQDVYKITRKLTVTIGVRFGWVTPYHLRSGQSGAAFSAASYDPSQSVRLYQPAMVNGRRAALDPITGATGPAVLIGGFVPGVGNPANGMITTDDIRKGNYPSGWRVQHGLNVAPRLGLAYDLFGNGKTAIRTGFGVGKRMLEDSGDYLYTIGVNPPFIYTPTMYYGNLNTFLSSSGVLFGSSVDSFEKDDHIPVTYNYSFGIQQDLTHGFALDVSYVGNASRHLMQNVNLNTVPYGARFLAKNVDPTTSGSPLPDAFLRPYPEYANITYRQNMGTSNYNSLQVQANRRMSSAGLQVGIAYTWSKTMGLTDQENGALNPWVAPKTWLWGPLGFDQTHMFSANYTWDVPRASRLVDNVVIRRLFDDWQISGITTFASGTPGSVTLTTSDGADINGGSAGARADVIAPTEAANRNFYQWFNAAAFARPARGTYGNAAQRNYRGPGINNWDLTLMKNIPLRHDTQNLRLRGEFYNAFNHTQYAGVDGTARFDASGRQINTTFGQVTSTRSPRVIQLSLSYRF